MMVDFVGYPALIMDLSNWVALAVGIGLGLGSGWVRRRPTVAAPPTPEVPPVKENCPEAESISAVAAPPTPEIAPVTGNSSEAELIKSLEAELAKTKAAYYLASQMSQFKGGFLARVSHELRSPINGLIGSHQLILSDLCDDPAEEREVLAQANNSAMKMIEMLDRVLNVARTEDGRNPMTIQALSLAQIFEEVHYLTAMQAANRNIPLNVIVPQPDIYVLADEDWLKQVLVNLVETGITPFGNETISVTARVAEDGGAACIWIDAEFPPEFNRESLDLLQKEVPNDRLVDNTELSLGLTMLMNQTVLELMKGRLEIQEASPGEASAALSRIQCSLPLATPQPPGD
ncbi:MAG TPA: sensor histidine kinase [Oscillatoriaceae cyanobacterium M33_DOE_052]|uniref:histidine kinase n=1 Tax=Planktothricoides sp. SpSt-374 TaxID=2282167 RepID=A0A7C3VMJ4_9CYAN|nr:sensor histidine kinase [Oscillatoriaceae cyanobacterium M33_DOE_052]